MDRHKYEGFTTRVEVIKTALREFFKNGNKDYHPEHKGEMGTSLEGGEENPKGGNRNGQMADRTAPEPDSTRLDDPERESHKTNNAGA